MQEYVGVILATVLAFITFYLKHKEELEKK